MALYEVVREIENSCSRNQMRDVFFDEIETDDPVEAIRTMLKDEARLELSAETDAEGNATVFANCSGIVQKFVFSRI